MRARDLMALTSPDIAKRLRAGELVEVNGRVFGICRGCRKLVRLDKPIFGSLHFCD